MPPLDRQVDHEDGPVSRGALDAHRSSVRFHDAPADREPQPCAFARGLRRKERLEDLRLELGRDPRAAVADVERHRAPRRVVPGRERDLPGRRRLAHCLVGVRQQIDHDLVELMGVDPHGRGVVDQVQAHLHAVHAERVGHQLHGLLDDLVQLHLRPLGRALARQREEVLDDAPAPLCGVSELLHVDRQGVVRELLRQQGRPPQHHGQGVVQLVGHASQKRAHRRELLALDEPLGAFAYLGLQPLVVRPEFDVKKAGLEKVLNAQEYFRRVEGLGEEVLRARGQGSSPGLLGHVGRESEHRKEASLGDEGLQRLHNPKAVGLRHEDVQENQVGLELGVEGEHLA